jgi:hypothetical protein
VGSSWAIVHAGCGNTLENLNVLGKYELVEILADHLAGVPAENVERGRRSVMDHIIRANAAQNIGAVLCQELVIYSVCTAPLVFGFRRNEP